MNTVLRFENALKWIKQNTIPNSGIAVTSGSGKPYCEVTGYLIPTLLNWQETELALSYGQWLVSCQHESGCWGDPDENQPYAFDTGQVIKGLLALAKKTDKSIWIRPIKKACEWIISHISETGKPYVPDIAAWDAAIPPAVLLYSLESVRWAGEYLNEPYWIEKIDKSVDWFLSQKELTRFSHLSHFYGYIMDALCDLGHKDRAAEGMEIIARIQERTGIIPAYPDVQWACSPGIFQLAGVWYKLGNQKLGDAAFGFGEELQNPSGGWFGSYGNNCSYFVDKEISWPVKFFMDTLQLKLKSNFEKMAPIFHEIIPPTDGRYALVHDSICISHPENVLDVGCGKGRYLKNLLEDFPDLSLHGTDLSVNVMLNLPQQIKKMQGSMLDLPYPDEYFDFVYTVEALEHAVNVDGALRELNRVLCPGGFMIIIDKNAKQLGRMELPSWEQWFGSVELKKKLELVGLSVIVIDNIPYEGKADGLFSAWIAQKNFIKEY